MPSGGSFREAALGERAAQGAPGRLVLLCYFPLKKRLLKVFQCASKLRRILVFVGACLRAILHFTD